MSTCPAPRSRPLRFSALQRAVIAEIYCAPQTLIFADRGFSALQRAEIAEIGCAVDAPGALLKVSVLFNEPKLLKWTRCSQRCRPRLRVSVLFNEPKLLKSHVYICRTDNGVCFSALQRAEIAEILDE